MTDKEIHDLLSEAWNDGKCIDWEGGVKTFVRWNQKDEKETNASTERFSAALEHVHTRKLNGDYDCNDIHIFLKAGGKNGKYWEMKTDVDKKSYTVTYGSLYDNKPSTSREAIKLFSSSAECFKEAQKKIKEKKKKKYKVEWDKSPSSKEKKYKNAYLELAKNITQSAAYDLRVREFADSIGNAMKNLFDANICNVIAIYCNEDKLDHNDCDKCFDDIGCPNTPIGRLHESVKNINDKAPSCFDIHLLEGIFGKGQKFGEDVCYGSIRVFSPQEMKIFATRMIDRLIENESDDSDLKNVIFGLKELNMDRNKDQDQMPALKKRKLNDLGVENVETEFVYSDDIIYKVAYSLSASGVFDERKKEILETKVFKLNGTKMPESYEWNHSLCVLAFGLNAAAMGNGVIAHYW